jgi:hypothetical protein
MHNLWHSPFKMLIFKLNLIVLLIVIINGEPYGGGGGGSSSAFGLGGHYGLQNDYKCPRSCTCTSTTVDCSQRSLTSVPKKIPLDCERL